MKGKKKSKRLKKASQKPSTKILCDKKSKLKSREVDEQNFRMLFDKALDGMLLVDIKTKKFLMSNKAICKMLGYSEKELINLSVSDLHPREQLKYVLKQFSMQAKGKIVLASNIPVLKKDRTIFYASISASPIQISGKKYLLGIFRDTTERKILTEKIEAEKEIAQQYLDIAGVMLVVIGSDQKVKLANKKTCQTLGYTEKQVIGSNWFDKFIPEHIRKNVKETFSKLMSCEITSAEYFENPVLTKSGQEKIIAWHNTVLRDKKGTITGTLSSGSDITELKKIEESLIHSEEKYRSFFTSVPVGWAYCKAVLDNKNKPEDYIFLEVNNAFEKLTGLKKENILGKKATKVIPQIKKTHWIEKFGNVAITGKPVKGETYLEPFNKWYSLYVSCPQKGYFITVLEDINSRKKFEEALRQSEEKYRIISENIPVVVYSALPDKYSTNIFLSGRAKELTGYTSEELVANPQLWGRIIFDEDKPQVWEAIEKHRARKTLLHVEYRIVCKNGSIKWIKDMATPMLDEQGKLIRIDGFMEDITDRKCAEEALKKSEKFQISVFNSIQDGVSVLDTEMRIVQVNSAMEKWYAHAMPLVGKKCYEAYHLANKVCAVCPTVETLANKKPSLKIVPKIGPGGKRLGWQELYSFPLMDNATGNMTGIIEYVRDITDRKQAEEKLQKSEKQLQTIFDTSHAGIIQIDPQGKIILANERTAQILGYSTEKLIGSNYIDHIHPSHKELANKMLLSLISGSIDTINTERLYIREDGSEFWGHNAARRITESDGILTGIVVIISDITGHKMLEEELLHSQKMEAIGQLAGGVAHDFNNILNAIIGFGSLLQMKMKDDDPLKQHVEQILGSADRAAELTHNLLAFSRKEPVNFKPVELNEIIAHVEKFLKKIIGENIEFTTKKSKNKLNILADIGHIEQIIINLATNARDAMPDGGQLIIGAESIEIDRNYIEMHGYGESGYYAVLSITDTGIGMSKEIQGKIFDPFFTTKEVNKGTGLGLAMTYGIVKQHKGFFNVYSEVGKGTCFKIYLPLTLFDRIEESASPAYKSLIGTETVLIAEDDEYLRKLSEAVLEEFGYKMISAEDGEEAVKKFADNKDKIDICIFDIIMPKKSGIKAYEEIKKIKPDVKAFFISGYTSDFISKDKFPEEKLTLLLKPFKPDTLLTKIRETLDK